MLVYDSKKINPKTFDSKNKDLRKLVGYCLCGKCIRGREAVPHPDPYSYQIYEDNTPIVQCENCDYVSGDGI